MIKYLIAIILLATLKSNGQERQRDTIPVIILSNDTLSFAWAVAYKGYSVREKHSTSEGVMDAGGMSCVDNNGKFIPCFEDYWKHIGYLNWDKKPFPPSIIIWQSKELKQP